jgi:hypothetical protein
LVTQPSAGARITVRSRSSFARSRLATLSPADAQRFADVVGLVYLFPRHRLYAKLITAAGFTFFLRQSLVVGDIGFRLFQRFLVTRLVNNEQNLVFLNQLVILDVYLRNQPGDVGAIATMSALKRASRVHGEAV